MPAAPTLRFTSHGLTHLGLVRRRNEDAFLDRAERGLWVVADGMGGHEAGDLASGMIVEALGAIEPPADLGDFVDAAAAELTSVDAALRRRAAMLGPGAVIASTVVMLLAKSGGFACLWAGDSRLYRWRSSAFQQLTVDHSKVQEMVDAGLLRPEEMAGHPLSHIVTRSIGGGRLELGMLRDTVQPGDRFLLCSDGLSNMVADSEVARELGTATPGEAAQRLRDLVLARGAIDNVTIVIAHAEPVS
ncbi:MAG TPA: PP2C family serine/threonine-protein phosphatase [Stellaceae bacterium]|nr:PP2C family serine/threonine-protein phosphatase [Stellaceae bacterium]